MKTTLSCSVSCHLLVKKEGHHELWCQLLGRAGCLGRCQEQTGKTQEPLSQEDSGVPREDHPPLLTTLTIKGETRVWRISCVSYPQHPSHPEDFSSLSPQLILRLTE